MTNEYNQNKEDITLLHIIAFLLRQRRKIVICTLIAGIVVALLTFALPREWSATGSFMPQAPVNPVGSQLTNLAGQLGFNIATGEEGQSPAFYANLLESRDILEPVAADTFEVADTLRWFGNGLRRGTLYGILNIDPREPRTALRTMKAVEWLQKHALSLSVDRETSMIHVSVRTHWPDLSAEIARRLFNRVNQFNLQVRRTEAGAERRFIEGRVDTARSDLRASEDALQAFLQENRGFENSPELLFQHDRLQRGVNMRQQVYTSLLQSYEEARIREVRNTPVITVVEQPIRPVRPDRRHVILKEFLALMMGGIVGVFAGLASDYTRGQGKTTDEALEITALWEESKNDLRRLAKVIRH